MDRAERDQVMEALKQLNRRLQFSERRLNDLSEQLPGAIFQSSLHPDGVEQLDYMSVDCEDLWAISSAQLKIDMSPLWAMIDPEDAPSMQASVAYSAETLTPWSQRWRIVTPSGARKWLHGRGRPSRLADGTVQWNSFILDITERMQREEELAETRRQAETAKQRLVDAIEGRRTPS